MVDKSVSPSSSPEPAASDCASRAEQIAPSDQLTSAGQSDNHNSNTPTDLSARHGSGSSATGESSTSRSGSQQYVHARSYSAASASSSLSVPGQEQPPRTGSPESFRTAKSNSKHSRTASSEYKETLDAVSKDLEDGSRVINQYKMLNEIGRGAYGTVHRGVLVDDESVEFAIKEFGKTRMRKNHRAANLRKPLARGRGRGRARGRGGFSARGVGPDGSPMREANELADKKQESASNGGDGQDSSGKREEGDEFSDPLYLVRHELAILKKLDHPHVVKLYEVLDDPAKDSLYMVFEYCPDGVVIDIQMHRSTKPLDENVARGYFRQILLGVEYLHRNDIVHRDLKPDNILLTDDRKTCKIVDFGVSEMFLKPGDDTLHKSAGSPAFMSPELCTAGHGDFHGKKDDIWSLGVTLFCMVVGHVPFDKDQFLALYESIKEEEPSYPSHLSAPVVSLLKRMLCKNPDKRADVAEMRSHPWVTDNGKNPLISPDENLEAVVTNVTEEELDKAVGKITNIFTIARVITRFKRAGSRSRAASHGSSDSTPSGTISRLAHATGVGHPPLGKIVTGGAAGIAGAVAGLVEGQQADADTVLGGDEMALDDKRAEQIESPVDMEEGSVTGVLKPWHGRFGSDSILSPVIEAQPSPVVDPGEGPTKEKTEDSIKSVTDDDGQPSRQSFSASEKPRSPSPQQLPPQRPCPPSNRRMDSLLSIGSVDSRAASSTLDGGDAMSRSASGRGADSNTSFESGDESECEDARFPRHDGGSGSAVLVDSPIDSDDELPQRVESIEKPRTSGRSNPPKTRQGPSSSEPGYFDVETAAVQSDVKSGNVQSDESNDSTPERQMQDDKDDKESTSTASLLSRLHLSGDSPSSSHHQRHHPTLRTIEAQARKAGVKVSEAITAFAQSRLSEERDIYERAKHQVQGAAADELKAQRGRNPPQGGPTGQLSPEVQPPRKAGEMEAGSQARTTHNREGVDEPENSDEDGGADTEDAMQKPRLLDAPVVQSPVNEGLPTPPGAGRLYQGFSDIGYNG